MISTWRTRRAMRRAAKKTMALGLGGNVSDLEVSTPAHFRCPISLDLMKDPVTLSTGITYDRESIEAWIDSGNHTCPVTNQPLRISSSGQDEVLIPNHTLRRMIQDWCVDNRSHGVERIPTPRIPVSTVVVLEMLSGVTEAARLGDHTGCVKLLEKMKNLMKESERNKRCVVGNGAAGVLAAAFNAFATNYSASNSSLMLFENSKLVLEEILALLSMMLPLDSLSRSYLSSSQHSLRCMAWFLKCGDIPARRNAAIAIKELCSDHQHLNSMTSEVIEDLVDPLFKLIKSPICPTSTKASLMSIYYLTSSKHELRPRFAKMGMVSLILEMLVDSEKSVCEKGLGVFDEMMKCEEGIELAYKDALTAPVLVKKLLRVSDLATEFAVSALWRLCKSGKSGGDGGDVFVEVLQVGASQKLLLVLQVGCGEGTKDKATELLKILNLHRSRAECIESVDFKDLKRPF